MNLPVLLAAESAFLNIHTGLIFWTLVTFFLVAMVLRAKAWGPILGVVAEREKQITNAIESAKRERAEAEKLLAEQKTAIAEARREAAETLRKNQGAMEKYREELMARARKEAEAAKADAERSIRDETRKAIVEIRGQAVDMAVEIASKLLGEKLDDARHRQLAQQFIEQLPAQPGNGRPRV